MAAEDVGDDVLSDPWTIDLDEIDDQSTVGLAAQTERLNLGESNAAAAATVQRSWLAHERLTSEILDEAAGRVSAEMFRNVSVSHPTRNHTPSHDGPSIRPDFIIAWSHNGARKNTAIVDAKDHYGNVPSRDYDKILRDMSQTKVCFLIPLLLNSVDHRSVLGHTRHSRSRRACNHQ